MVETSFIILILPVNRVSVALFLVTFTLVYTIYSIYIYFTVVASVSNLFCSYCILKQSSCHQIPVSVICNISKIYFNVVVK